jgi:hypothetical protein
MTWPRQGRAIRLDFDAFLTKDPAQEISSDAVPARVAKAEPGFAFGRAINH